MYNGLGILYKVSSFFFSLSQLSKTIDSNLILDDVNLDVNKGEFWSIVGPSGVGKSTLFELIGGFCFPDSGGIFLDGEDVTRLAPSKRPVNMLFQTYALFPHMTVWENVAYGLRCARCDRAYIVEKVKHMLELMHLYDLRDFYPSQLSGGQKQRVAMARCLVKTPKLVLLDEPFSACDRSIRGKIQRELREYHQGMNTTLLHITHEPQDALGMSTHIAVMGGKTIQQSGPAAEVYDRPKSVHVARSLGDMNIFTCSKMQEEDAVVIAKCKFTDTTVKLSSKEDVADVFCCGVRPERCEITTVGQGDVAANALSGVISTVLLQGYGVKYEIFVAKGSSPFVVFVLRCAAEKTLEVGQQVWVRWNADAVVHFT